MTEQATRVDPELNFVRCLCRHPEFVTSLPPDIVHDLSPKGVALPIVRKMIEVHKSRKPVTLEMVDSLLAEEQNKTGRAQPTLEDMQRMYIDCTSQMLKGYQGTVAIVRMVGKKRRTEAVLKSSYDYVVRSASTDIDEVVKRIVEEIGKINQVGTDEGTFILEDILEEYFSRDISETSWKIPTGFTFLDHLMEGGMTMNDMLVLYGPFKNGKTQTARAILRNASNYLYRMGEGHSCVHLAHDGGNKYKHACYYLAMEIQAYLMEHKIHYFGEGTDRNGYLSDQIPLISPYNVEVIRRAEMQRMKGEEYTGPPLYVRIPSEVQDVILDKIHGLEKSDKRNIRIYDAKVIRHDLDRAVALLERCVNEGARFIMADHAGEFGEPGKTAIYDRTSIGAQTFANFAREHDVVVMVLSQVNQTGINLSADDKNPHMEGGTAYVVKADMAARCDLVGKSPHKRIKVTVTHGRFTEGGTDVSTELVPLLASGMISNAEEIDEDGTEPTYSTPYKN